MTALVECQSRDLHPHGTDTDEIGLEFAIEVLAPLTPDLAEGCFVGSRTTAATGDVGGFSP